QKYNQLTASGSSEPGQSKVGPCANNKVPTPRGPNLDRANRRSAAPDDQVAPPYPDQTNRRTDPDRSPAAPSCAAPADDPLNPTESRIVSRLNGSSATESGEDRNTIHEPLFSAIV